METAFATSELGEKDGIVLPPDLERPVALLTKNLDNAATAMYNLHTALVNKFGLSDPILAQLRRSMGTFQAECERLMTFFQTCYGHAETYASLCQFSLSHPKSECLAFAASLLPGGRKILAEANDLSAWYTKAHDGLLGGNKLLWEFGEAASSVRKDSLPHASTAPFVQALRSVQYPNGAQSETAFNLAFGEITSAMKDIVGFWNDHVGPVDSEHVKLPQTENEVQSSVVIWGDYQSMLLSAVSSISKSSDVVKANPLGAISFADAAVLMGRRQKALRTAMEPTGEKVKGSIPVTSSSAPEGAPNPLDTARPQAGALSDPSTEDGPCHIPGPTAPLGGMSGASQTAGAAPTAAWRWRRLASKWRAAAKAKQRNPTATGKQKSIWRSRPANVGAEKKSKTTARARKGYADAKATVKATAKATMNVTMNVTTKFNHRELWKKSKARRSRKRSHGKNLGSEPTTGDQDPTPQRRRIFHHRTVL